MTPAELYYFYLVARLRKSDDAELHKLLAEHLAEWRV